MTGDIAGDDYISTTPLVDNASLQAALNDAASEMPQPSLEPGFINHEELSYKVKWLEGLSNDLATTLEKQTEYNAQALMAIGDLHTRLQAVEAYINGQGNPTGANHGTGELR